MARFCGNCGTEVDDTAVFCPTCGQPIDEAAAAEIPAAPAWPEPAASDASPAPGSVEAPSPQPAEASEDTASEAQDDVTPASRRGNAAPAGEPPADRQPRAWERPSPAVDDAPTRVEQRPPPEDPGVSPPIPAASAPDAQPPGDRSAVGERREPGSPQVELPFTMPVTLSGWLIGIGAVLAVLGLIVVLIARSLNVIDLLLLVALLGVAATVFLSAQMPAIPHLRLISLIVALIAFGVALDRVGFTGGGAGELLLFMGSAAAAIGAVLLELGQDQPLGRPQR